MKHARIAVVLVLLVTACGTSDTVKVGIVTPLTGPGSSYGEQVQTGIRTAQKIINEDGGVYGKRVELKVRDSQCSAEHAVAGTRTLTTVEDLVAVIGYVCSDATIPAVEVGTNHNLSLVTATASTPEITDSEFAFRVNPNDLAQAGSIADYLERNDILNISILAVNDAYGNGVAEQLRRSYDGRVVDTVSFPPATKDFQTPVLKLRDAAATVVIASPTQHPLIAEELSGRQVADFNFGLVEEATDAMRGTVYPTVTFNSTSTEQARRLSTAVPNATIVHAWGFDSLWVTAKAAEHCTPVTSQCIKKHLGNLSYRGAAGANTIKPGGEIAQPPFTFKRR